MLYMRAELVFAPTVGVGNILYGNSILCAFMPYKLHYSVSLWVFSCVTVSAAAVEETSLFQFVGFS